LVPEFCDLAFDRQLFPGEPVTEAENEIKDLLHQTASEFGIHMDLVRTQSFPAWQLSHDADVTRLLQGTYKQRYGRSAAYTGFNGYSEAELLARHGLPSLIFGPGDLAVAHAPNESISLDEVIEAAKVYALLGMIR
jgi:acetylornithine deacetylase/succinyl-diaminopimelate desuccinylase-like protein